MSSRREYLAAMLLCAAGAALLLVAGGQEWVRGDTDAVRDGWVSALSDSLATGLERAPAKAAGLAALAGVVAIAATKRWARRVVGAVLLLVGVYGAWIAARAAASHERGTSTGWPWVAVAGGVLVAAAGLLAAVRGSRWSAMSSRYDGPQNARAHEARDGEAGLWDALSRGDDPT